MKKHTIAFEIKAHKKRICAKCLNSLALITALLGLVQLLYSIIYLFFNLHFYCIMIGFTAALQLNAPFALSFKRIITGKKLVKKCCVSVCNEKVMFSGFNALGIVQKFIILLYSIIHYKLSVYRNFQKTPAFSSFWRLLILQSEYININTGTLQISYSLSIELSELVLQLELLSTPPT